MASSFHRLQRFIRQELLNLCFTITKILSSGGLRPSHPPLCLRKPSAITAILKLQSAITSLIFNRFLYFFQKSFLMTKNTTIPNFRSFGQKFFSPHWPNIGSDEVPMTWIFLFRFCPSSNLAPDLASKRSVESFRSIWWVWRELSCHRTDRRTDRQNGSISPGSG